MQQLLISPHQNSLNTTTPSSTSLLQRQTTERADTSQILSISVLEWLNAELRKEVEKQEIVALRANVNMMDRLQNMLSSNATGITIMVASFFLV
tara:strand:+ start:130342 stop:130623 length:282 start_codon:yes stop_codon:yes gene_type:complete